MSAKARRCTPCDVLWPDLTSYKKCPGCGAETWEMPATPISTDEARQLADDMTLSRQRREEFEQFYADREVERAMANFDQEAAALLEA